MNTQAEPSARQKLEAALHALTHPMGNMTDRNERVMQILKARTAYAEAAGPEAIRALLAEHDALTQSQRAEIERLRTALEFGIGLYDETHNARQQAQSLYEWVNVANAAITPQ